jgi:hypothetical protein
VIPNRRAFLREPNDRFRHGKPGALKQQDLLEEGCDYLLHSGSASFNQHCVPIRTESGEQVRFLQTLAAPQLGGQSQFDSRVKE